MSTKDNKKVTITDVHFSHTEEQHFDPYADIEIAGCTEHNARVRERQRIQAIREEGNLTRQELAAINKSLQAQIDEQKAELITTQDESNRTKRRGWIQFAISSIIGAAGVIIALIALFINK